MFKILKKDKKTKARLGVLSTPHGKILTPSYVFVGTYGKFRNLTPRDIKKTKTQLVIANTFHLWKKALQGRSLLVKKTILAEGFGNIPTMTDSGGFQVLSLAFGDKNKVGKFMTGYLPELPGKTWYKRRDKNKVGKILTTLNVVYPQVVHRRKNVKITKEGVYFLFNEKKKFLGPELSM